MTASEMRRVSPADVAWTDVAGRVVIVRLADTDSEPVILESSASQIWLGIASGLPFDDLVAELSEAYDESVATIAAGVADFIQDGLGVGILQRG